MMPEYFVRMFTISYQTLLLNTKSINHKESIKQFQPGANCMNWIVGHIIVSRNDVFKMLGHEQVWDKHPREVYARGSSGTAKAEVFYNFITLLSDLKQNQKQLMSVLKKCPVSVLQKESRPGKTIADDLAFLYFHESYHAGQTGLLRRLLGKQGAIE